MHRSGVAAGVVVPVGAGVLARIGVPGGVRAGAKPPPPVCVGGDVVAVGSGTPVGVGGPVGVGMIVGSTGVSVGVGVCSIFSLAKCRSSVRLKPSLIAL